jgi:hypothetical protein
MRSRTPNETRSGITGFLPTDASMTSLAARCAPPRQLHAIPPLASLSGKSCVPLPFERFWCLGEIGGHQDQLKLRRPNKPASFDGSL